MVRTRATRRAKRATSAATSAATATSDLYPQAIAVKAVAIAVTHGILSIALVWCRKRGRGGHVRLGGCTGIHLRCVLVFRTFELYKGVGRAAA